MARYNPSSYEDPNEPTLWQKTLFVLALCGLVRLLLWFFGLAG
ncbi:hypothetical protein [Hymenobacter profundi]|nr:hypothetical protein [Hymenobacter profundi]